MSENLVPPRLAVIWMDWYAYHIARLQGLLSVPQFADSVVGIELVGGVGFYPGLNFREQARKQLPIHTLLPDCSWHEAGQLRLARLLWARLNLLKPAAVMVPGYATLPALAAALWARVHGKTSILMTESTAYDHERVGWKELIKAKLLRLLFDVAVTGGPRIAAIWSDWAFPKTKSPATTMSLTIQPWRKRPWTCVGLEQASSGCLCVRISSMSAEWLQRRMSRVCSRLGLPIGLKGEIGRWFWLATDRRCPNSGSWLRNPSTEVKYISQE